MHSHDLKFSTTEFTNRNRVQKYLIFGMSLSDVKEKVNNQHEKDQTGQDNLTS